jgi:hypothetical protein
MKPQKSSSRLSMQLLARLVPADLREAFVGDLIEEAQRVVRSSPGQWRRRLWLSCQLLGSIPALVGLRITREGSSMKRRASAAALMVTMGLLQAWDARVFQSSTGIVGMVLVGILVPVVAILRTRHYLRFVVALVVACILLILARIASPTSIGRDLLAAVVVLWTASLLVYGPSQTDGPRQMV